jgi:APA family basic amino acid/polyamine antiporter
VRNAGAESDRDGERGAAGDKRSLGFWMCTALVIGNIIGIGIFAMPADLAPYGLNALGGWGVNLVGCAFLALSFAGLARAFPRDDGPAAYMARAFGRGVAGNLTAYLVMWCYWVSIPVANAAIAIGAVGYLAILFPALNRAPGLPALTAQGIIWLFVLTNLLGARAAGWVQILTTALKLLPQLAVIVLGVWLFLTQPALYGAHVPPNPASLREINSVSALAMFAMLGIECAMVPAGRVRDPRRNIPRATLVGTLLTAIIYIAISVVPILLIPQKELAASSAPYADLFTRVLGGQYGVLIALFVTVSALGVLNGWTLIAGEAVQALSRHGGFPAVFSRENSRGAPAFALLLTGVLTSLMLFINYTDSVSRVFAFLTLIATAADLPLYLVSPVALALLKLRAPATAPARSRMPTLLVCAAAIGYCVWVSIGIGAGPLLWTVALAAAGLPVYLWTTLAQRRTAAVQAS